MPDVADESAERVLQAGEKGAGRILSQIIRTAQARRTSPAHRQPVARSYAAAQARAAMRGAAEASQAPAAPATPQPPHRAPAAYGDSSASASHKEALDQQAQRIAACASLRAGFGGGPWPMDAAERTASLTFTTVMWDRGAALLRGQLDRALGASGYAADGVGGAAVRITYPVEAAWVVQEIAQADMEHIRGMGAARFSFDEAHASALAEHPAPDAGKPERAECSVEEYRSASEEEMLVAASALDAAGVPYAVSAGDDPGTYIMSVSPTDVDAALPYLPAALERELSSEDPGAPAREALADLRHAPEGVAAPSVIASRSAQPKPVRRDDAKKRAAVPTPASDRKVAAAQAEALRAQAAVPDRKVRKR